MGPALWNGWISTQKENDEPTYLTLKKLNLLQTLNFLEFCHPKYYCLRTGGRLQSYSISKIDSSPSRENQFAIFALELYPFCKIH
jgi:hypothetical protein